VEVVNDQKRIAVHSTTRLRNASGYHLDVRLCHAHSEPESVHPLPSGATLPLPLRADGGAAKLCLRPSSGEQDWCAMTRVPGGTGDMLPSVTVPLECAPAQMGASAWYCLLHHSGGANGGVCELVVQPTVELRNLLAGPLRFELLGSGVAVGRTLAAGESLRTHAFAQGTAISFSMAVAGYAPSERQLVSAPPTYDDDVLCREGMRCPSSNCGRVSATVCR
jgi:vacuolar protein sorting-associated protein 13A/C